jgi:hypothetical protein
VRPSKLAPILCFLCVAQPVSAQRLFDLQVRATAAPDALTPGTTAVFWNPAATVLFGGRGEALIVDVRGASPTGLDGVALAGAYHLDPRTTIAAGYQHAGIDDIRQTTDDPISVPGGTIDVSEDMFGVALARTVGPALTFGATIRYARAAELAGGDDVVEFGAGMLFAADIPLRPTLGAAARIEEDGTNWLVGVEVAPPIALDEWTVRASAGTGESPRVHGLTHRVAAIVDWRNRVSVSAGIAGEPDGPGRTWQPLASVGVRLGRYSIGVLREQLPNDFGAIHSLRFSVMFGGNDRVEPATGSDRPPSR